MFYLEHCFLFVQLIELLCIGICLILPMFYLEHCFPCQLGILSCVMY